MVDQRKLIWLVFFVLYSTYVVSEKADGYEKEHTTLEYWEDNMCNLNETRRYRRIVGSLAGSCLLAAIPLLSSLSEPACLVSLDIVQVLNHGYNLIIFLTKSGTRSCLLGAITYFYFFKDSYLI